MDFRNSADWTFPVPIYYGPERINEVSALCKNHGIKRPLVVTDNGSADLEIIKNLISQLNLSGLKCDLFSNISPKISSLRTGSFTLGERCSDLIIL